MHLTRSDIELAIEACDKWPLETLEEWAVEENSYQQFLSTNQIAIGVG